MLNINFVVVKNNLLIDYLLSKLKITTLLAVDTQINQFLCMI